MQKPKTLELEFTKNAQVRLASRFFRALLFDGFQVSNAPELLDWSQDKAITWACEICGLPGCGMPGADLLLRQVAGYLALIPLASPPDRNNEETEIHQASSSVQKKNIFLLSDKQCAQLRNFGLNFRYPKDYPTMSKEELRWTLRWDAPKKILGIAPEPTRVNRKRIYAVSEGDIEDWCDYLENCLQYLGNPADFQELPVHSNECPITFYLGEPDWVEWTPLLLQKPDCYLMLTDRIALHIGTNVSHR